MFFCDDGTRVNVCYGVHLLKFFFDKSFLSDFGNKQTIKVHLEEGWKIEETKL